MATVAGGPGGVGLTTAMVQLRTGWLLVGSLPATDGKIATAGSGCLLELSPTGRLSGTISGSYLDGPWDAAVADHGATATLYVTNTLAGGLTGAFVPVFTKLAEVDASTSSRRTRPVASSPSRPEPGARGTGSAGPC